MENFSASSIIQELLRMLDFCQVSRQTTNATTKVDVKFYCQNVSKFKSHSFSKFYKIFCFSLRVLRV
jgi:hypothetical protein